MKYVSVEKPESCPKCVLKRVVIILYGYPSNIAQLEEEAGKIIIGCCMITGNDPLWGCVDCNKKIYRRKSKRWVYYCDVLSPYTNLHKAVFLGLWNKYVSALKPGNREIWLHQGEISFEI